MSLLSGMQSRSGRSGASSNFSRALGTTNVAGQTYADKKKAALAAKNTSVLSFDELERIKGMCS